MFKRFFNALAGLTDAVDALKASVTEANANFRANLGLDGPADVPALEHQTEQEPVKNGRKRAAAR
jgi:hypothetical protein